MTDYKDAEIERLKVAAYKMYTQTGTWHRNNSTPEEDAKIWEWFRDAFGIEKGTATRLGIDGYSGN